MAHPKSTWTFITRMLGRVRLNCVGTGEDLASNTSIREGLILTLYADDLDDGGHVG